MIYLWARENNKWPARFRRKLPTLWARTEIQSREARVKLAPPRTLARQPPADSRPPESRRPAAPEMLRHAAIPGRPGPRGQNIVATRRQILWLASPLFLPGQIDARMVYAAQAPHSVLTSEFLIRSVIFFFRAAAAALAASPRASARAPKAEPSIRS